MRKPWKYGMLGALIVIAVLYGIELTSQGLADVYGPLDREPALPAQQEVETQQTAAPGVAAETPKQQPITEVGGDASSENEPAAEQDVRQGGVIPTVPSGTGESSVNRLADGTAGLLQSVTSGGIRLVVSVFEAITD